MLQAGKRYSTSTKHGSRVIVGRMEIERIEGDTAIAWAYTHEYSPSRPEQKTRTFYPQFPISPDRVNDAGAVRVLQLDWQPEE